MLDEYNYNENESGRTETLIKALEKVELLQKKLNVAIYYLNKYADEEEWCGHNDSCADIFFDSGVDGGYYLAQKALKQIDEV